MLLQGRFENPYNRATLTREDCLRLDEHVRLHPDPDRPAGTMTSVVAAYDLQQSLRLRPGTRDASEAAQQRAAALRREASVALMGLFQYRRSGAAGASAVRRITPLPPAQQGAAHATPPTSVARRPRAEGVGGGGGGGGGGEDYGGWSLIDDDEVGTGLVRARNEGRCGGGARHPSVYASEEIHSMGIDKRGREHDTDAAATRAAGEHQRLVLASGRSRGPGRILHARQSSIEIVVRS
jgi:hypothetical protein